METEIRTFLDLEKVHQELDALFCAHRIALLERDLGQALNLLRSFRSMKGSYLSSELLYLLTLNVQCHGFIISGMV